MSVQFIMELPYGPFMAVVSKVSSLYSRDMTPMTVQP